jgi:excinuclease ABC subunit C
VASYEFSRDLGSDEEIFRSFLNQFYGSNRFVPDQVLVPVETSDAGVLEEWLSDQKGRRVEVICPQRGEKKRVVELANKNARQSHRVETSPEERRRKKMESLQRLIDLPALPWHVECFDVSTLTGREAVGSMVVFRGAEPDKSSYRRYKIKNADADDDTAMMREVLHRRYRRLKDEDQPRPDLVVVDGGKAQLGVALEVLSELDLDLTVAALAKARVSGGRQVKGERVFRPGEDEAVALPEDSYGYRLITAIRDEAHRFAVNYHRKLRRKSSQRSPLMDVEGIGEKLSARIVDHFGGMNRVREADVEQLSEVKGVSPRLGSAIYRYLHDQED